MFQPLVDALFQQLRAAVVAPAMQQQRPRPHRIFRECKLMRTRRKNSPKTMCTDTRRHRSSLCRGLHKVVTEVPDATIPCPPQIVRGEPPNEVEDVRAGKFRDPVPGDRRRPDLRRAGCKHEFQIASDLCDPLDNNPLRAVLLSRNGEITANRTFCRGVHAGFCLFHDSARAAHQPRVTVLHLSPSYYQPRLPSGSPRGAAGVPNTGGNRKMMPTRIHR